jgi:hypothetical protein
MPAVPVKNDWIAMSKWLDESQGDIDYWEHCKRHQSEEGDGFLNFTFCKSPQTSERTQEVTGCDTRCAVFAASSKDKPHSLSDALQESIILLFFGYCKCIWKSNFPILRMTLLVPENCRLVRSCIHAEFQAAVSVPSAECRFPSGLSNHIHGKCTLLHLLHRYKSIKLHSGQVLSVVEAISLTNSIGLSV